MALHNELTASNLHKIYPWSYANAAARTGATGFTSADLGHLALQVDDYSLWVLTAVTPTWKRVDYDSSHTHSNATTSIAGFMAAADKTKLDGIETGATADQSANEILTALLGVDGASSLLDADLLDGQEGSYYRNAGNLNAGTLPALRFDDTAHGSRSGGSLHSVAVTGPAGSAGFMSNADKTKLDGIETGATADMSASEILTALLGVDGTGSGLDSDLLDGLHGSSYLQLATAQTVTAVHEFTPGSAGNIITFGANAQVLCKTVDTSVLRFCGGIGINNGAYIQAAGRDHATQPGWLAGVIGGYDSTGNFTIISKLSDTSSVNLFRVDYSSNVWIGTPIAAGSETRTLKMQSGTAPSSAGTDRFAMYGKDIGAGKCAPHFLTEDSKEISLYQGTAIADATDGTSVIARCNDILSYMRARGFIAT